MQTVSTGFVILQGCFGILTLGADNVSGFSFFIYKTEITKTLTLLGALRINETMKVNHFAWWQ